MLFLKSFYIIDSSPSNKKESNFHIFINETKYACSHMKTDGIVSIHRLFFFKCPWLHGGRKCGTDVAISSTAWIKGGQKDFLYGFFFAMTLAFSLFLMHPIMPSLHVPFFPLTNRALHLQMLIAIPAISCFPACQPHGEFPHCFHLAVDMLQRHI